VLFCGLWPLFWMGVIAWLRSYPLAGDLAWLSA